MQAFVARAVSLWVSSAAALAGPIQPASAEDAVNLSAASTIELKVSSTPDGRAVESAETRAWFDFGTARFGCDDRVVVLKNEVRSSTGLSGMEYSTDIDAVTIVALPADETGVGAPLYTISLQGENRDEPGTQKAEITTESGWLSVRIGDQLLPVNWRIHDLATGKFVAPSNYPGLAGISVEGDCGRERYAALSNPHDNAAVDDIAGNAVTRVTYASPDGPIVRALLIATAKAYGAHGLKTPGDVDLRIVDPATGDIAGRIPAQGSDQQTFGSLAIRLYLPSKTKIDIPIAGDTLDLGAATLPEGFSLIAEP